MYIFIYNAACIYIYTYIHIYIYIYMDKGLLKHSCKQKQQQCKTKARYRTGQLILNKHKRDDTLNRNTYTQKFTQHPKTQMCSDKGVKPNTICHVDSYHRTLNDSRNNSNQCYMCYLLVYFWWQNPSKKLSKQNISGFK